MSVVTECSVGHVAATCPGRLIMSLLARAGVGRQLSSFSSKIPYAMASSREMSKYSRGASQSIPSNSAGRAHKGRKKAKRVRRYFMMVVIELKNWVRN
jgi:hypothetical protein